MRYTPRRGLSIPTVTIFDDAGKVIEDEQRRVIRHVAQDGFGADMIFGAGTTGEWNRLENFERQRTIEITIDEVRQINRSLTGRGISSIEAWVGINGSNSRETLENLELALSEGADAVVIAPLAIGDLEDADIVRFFQRDIAGVLEPSQRELPVFLYDNADIAAPGHGHHIRTRTVKDLSRLEWVSGIKVSAPRGVLGNYTKAALHFKKPGEFGIYIGNAMLVFDWFMPRKGFAGRIREGWRDYLLHDTLPIGVVSGPANVQPREWQKAWRSCWSGDTELITTYRELFTEFEHICQRKTIACIKQALAIDGVISSASGNVVGNGTRALSLDEASRFRDAYEAYTERARRASLPLWQTVGNRVNVN